MVLVMYDNCYQKWLNMHQRKEIDKTPGDIPKYSSKRHEETKMWMGKYSDSCSGNSPYGGWGDKGIEEFSRVRAQIVKLRHESADAIAPIEMDAVKRFTDAYEAERKRKKRANGGDEDETPTQKRQKAATLKAVAEFDDDV